MGHHLLAFFTSLAASLTNAKLNAVEDGQFTLNNNNFLLPQRMQVQRAYVLGLPVTEARIVVPSLRAVTFPRLHPVDKAATPSNDPSILRYLGNGPTLLGGEGVSLEASTDATGGPNNCYGLLWIAPSFVPAPPGPCFTMKATATITVAAGVWGRGSLVLENDLPAGQYALIGADAQGVNVAAVRFRFPNNDLLPGIVAQQADGEFLTDHQRYGRMGLFGTFNNINLPTIECLGLGAGSAQTIYLDIVRLS